MKVVMTLLVRDEADILPALLEYHLDQGVDFFIATDNRSEDATAAILRRYERAGRLHYIYEPDDTYAQHEWVTRMARLAATEFGADWVINSDADEFWWPEAGGSLKDVLAAVPAEVAGLQAARSNFVPLPDEALTGVPFWEAMVIRERQSLNPLGEPLPPKVCHRADPGVEVAQGNHEVALSGGERVRPTEELVIFHFPMRGFRRFENKIAKGGAAYGRNRRLDRSVGNTWRQLYERYQQGGLADYYEGQVVREPLLAARRADGTYLEETRLRDRLRDLLETEGAAGRGRMHVLARRAVRRVQRPLWRAAARRRSEGIVTLADQNYFEGLKLLHGSVQEQYPAPIICYDLGLTGEQRAWCEHYLPGVEVRPIPDDPVIHAIQQGLDGPELAKKEKRQWPLWICPFLIAASPFRRTFWMDCDMAALRGLRALFRRLDAGPVFTPENLAPEKTANPAALYDLLPVGRPFERHLPLVNGGLSGWDLERDRAALEAYMHPIRRALDEPALREAIAWHDQGCLIWAIQSQGLEQWVMPTWQWNLSVRHTRAAGRPFHWEPGVLERLRRAAPQANILHWNGSTVPWRIPSD